VTFWFCFFASWYQYSTAIADNSGSEDDEIDFMLNDGRFIGKPMRPLRKASAFGVSSRYSPNGKPLIPFVHAIMLEDSTHSMTHRETVHETDICVRARARTRTHMHTQQTQHTHRRSSTNDCFLLFWAAGGKHTKGPKGSRPKGSRSFDVN